MAPVMDHFDADSLSKHPVALGSNTVDDGGALDCIDCHTNLGGTVWTDGAGNDRLICVTPGFQLFALDPASGRFATAYLERIRTAFRRTLANAQRDRDLADTANIDELASFLTTALIGIAASVRAEAPSDQVHAAARVAVSALDAYRQDV